MPPAGPDEHGRFGAYGGRYVPETLIPALEELDAAFRAARSDPEFERELSQLLVECANRPTPLASKSVQRNAASVRLMRTRWGGARFV